MINDEDCDTEYPAALPDEIPGPSDGNSLPQPALLLASTQVTRLCQPLLKVLRSLCISLDTFLEFDKHISECMRLFPPQLRLSSSEPLDLADIVPIIYLQNIRLIVSRHNLSPSCSMERRTQAIEQCLQVACETAGLLSRCVDQSSSYSEWRSTIRTTAGSFVCTHIWRCMLFTLFRGVFDAFHALWKVAATVEQSRPVNASCGRYILYFLRNLIDRVSQSRTVDLTHDEEMLAYLSADLQSSSNNSWVWDGAETGTYLAKRQKHGRTKQANRTSESPTSPQLRMSSFGFSLSAQESRDWGGWDQVDQAARYLQQQWRWPSTVLRSQDQQPLSAGPVPILSAPTRAAAEVPVLSEPHKQARSPQTQSSSYSRMNIAHLI